MRNNFMHNILFFAKINLLSRLPVSIARKWLERLVCIQPLKKNTNGNKQLLIDVSVIIGNDGRTGIQRVVRALLLRFLKHPPDGYTVRPIFATRRRGYRYAPDDFGLLQEKVSSLIGAIPVQVGAGDCYLSLDLTAHLLHHHKAQLAQWKCAGAQIHIIMYDLLPVLHPHWFNPITTKNFHRWLRTIAIFSNSVICISNVVKKEFNNWLYQHYAVTPNTLPVNTIHLGADIQSSAPSLGLPDNTDKLLEACSSKPTLLMVGTIEPRKGHSQVLAAVEKLWERGHEINLIIVGKPGWKTELLQQTLRQHPQNQTSLYWLDDASDELLELLYAKCLGVIVASHAEGYGLPLVEAMRHNKPVLARDLPIFREIGENDVTFFSAIGTENFANEIQLWLSNMNVQPTKYNARQYSWQDCANELLACLELAPSVPTQPDHQQVQLTLNQKAAT